MAVLPQVGGEIRQLVNSEFFVYIVPFLLTFAIVYGLLEKAKIPSDKNVRAMLGFLSAALVLPIAPAFVGFLSPLSGGLVLAIAGFLFLIVLLELLGVHKIKIKGDEIVSAGDSIFVRHSKSFALIFIAFAVVIFANSGGFDLLGIRPPEILLNGPLVFFFIVVLLVVWAVIGKE